MEWEIGSMIHEIFLCPLEFAWIDEFYPTSSDGELFHDESIDVYSVLDERCECRVIPFHSECIDYFFLRR